MGGSSVKYDRKRAVALKASDAEDLLRGRLPHVLKTMTRDQIQQMQRVLDAAVVNPVVQQEYADAVRRSVVLGGGSNGQYETVYQDGRIVTRDKSMVRRADRIFEQQIPISKSDKRIRLDVWSLLTPDAFTPITNNPDEAEFYVNLAGDLEKRGVWLCFEPKRVRDPEDPSRWIIDPRNFEVWLSFGVGEWPNPIPTKTGLIDQESLKGTQSIGAAFYDRVHRGPFMKELDKAMDQLFEAINDGEQEHLRQDGVRANAAPLVPTISDWLGGAEYASPKVWKKAWDVYHQAWGQRNGGDVLGAVGTVVAAAVLTDILARKLNDYIEKTVAGASKAVKIAIVIVVVVGVLDIVNPLLKMGVRVLIRRFALKQAVGAEARALAKGSARHVDDADLVRRSEGYQKDIIDWVRKNPDVPASEHVTAVERFMRKWKVKEADWMKVTPGPKGTVSRYQSI